MCHCLCNDNYFPYRSKFPAVMIYCSRGLGDRNLTSVVLNSNGYMFSPPVFFPRCFLYIWCNNKEINVCVGLTTYSIKLLVKIVFKFITELLILYGLWVSSQQVVSKLMEDDLGCSLIGSLHLEVIWRISLQIFVLVQVQSTRHVGLY